MKVGVVGGGLSGIGAALELVKAGVEVVLYEKENELGVHPKTFNIHGFDLDLDFMLFNRVSYPNVTALFDELSIDVEASNMSFSVSLDEGHGCKWGTRNGLRSLFAQKSNVLDSNFRGMLQEIRRFKDDALMFLEGLGNNPDMDRSETLGDFFKTRNFSELFKKAYLVSGYPQWFTVKGCSKYYVNKLRKELEDRGCQIRTSSEVHSVSMSDKGCILICNDGSEHIYNECILAVSPPDAMNILGKEASYDEVRILGALQYINRDVYLHGDEKFMPRNSTAWSAWNFTGITNVKMCLTYWLNVLQAMVT